MAILSTVFQRKMAEWNDHTDVATGEVCRGFMDVVCGLVQRLPEPSTIEKQDDKNALQTLDMSDPEAGEAFKAEHYLDMKNFRYEKLVELQTIRQPTDRKVQDYRFTYNDICDWQRRQKQ